MAAISPAAVISHDGDATSTASPTTTLPSKNQRSQNKPKCIKCGNVARSRCPFQSCKNCCAKAQNPCHIHVLKGSSNIPEKLPSCGTSKVDQQSTESSQSGGNTPHRIASLRQLSSSFAQFNNLQSPAKSRKPLTQKDAQVLNEWRFSKLKEFKDGEVGAENEAFDRYRQNVGLLEEVFSVNTVSNGETDYKVNSRDSPEKSEDDSQAELISGFKLKFRSNPVRVENMKRRMQYVVDQGLRELRQFESDNGDDDPSDIDDLGNRPKRPKSGISERASTLSDLMDKLNNARNEEDIQACVEMKSQLYNQNNLTSEVKSDDTDASTTPLEEDGSSADEKSVYSPPKWFTTTTIDQESLARIDAHFCSLEDIEDL
ncbi:hypothetical protein LIER_30385 [Lithospermum erythrorhizon]|uniref:Uncharacterized protein n=1 Tax=Lithospermum erythrorhizon TaxID=34254 RepID=A0AAV3RR55_LITER